MRAQRSFGGRDFLGSGRRETGKHSGRRQPDASTRPAESAAEKMLLRCSRYAEVWTFAAAENACSGSVHTVVRV